MNIRALVFFFLSVLLLGGLYVLFRPQPAAPPPAARTEAPLPVAAPRRFELVLQQGQLQSGPALIRVTQGEEVILDVRSDRDDELHLHGYDFVLRLQADVPASLVFTADRSGRFEYELHHAHRDLGALEVLPRP